MKKITLFILTIFTVATLFAAARPSLDGRAVVADAGSMPRGLFARTVGYLPGDSVTVTNPATGSTVDVLILGAIDPSEGVAILLSPEAAEGLRIRANSNVQVKLTKRSGSLDENANGSAVLSDVAEEEAAKSLAKEEAVEEAKNEPEEENVQETPAIAGNTSPAPEYEETPVLAETPAEPVIEKADEQENVAPVAIAAIPVASEIYEEKEPETVYEEVPALQEENLEKVTEDGLPADEEKLQKVVVLEEEPVYPEAGEKINEELPVVEESVVILDENLPASEENDGKAESVALAGEPEISEPALSENAVSEANGEDDAYQPIILVPTEPKAPVAETEVVAVPVEAAESPLEETAAVTEPSAEPVVEKVAALKAPVSNDWTNYVVPSVKNLRSGCYYVQVASLGNTDNIKNFVDKYSCKYPIVLVQNSGKTVYQMMVGPLNIDEYGSVDEKFKAYGFKDAFVRKIK